jgi:hypothetical protein
MSSSRCNTPMRAAPTACNKANTTGNNVTKIRSQCLVMEFNSNSP